MTAILKHQDNTRLLIGCLLHVLQMEASSQHKHGMTGTGHRPALL
jgi:hypothetical protein